MARKEYEMTARQLADLLNACKPVPYIIVGGMPPRSPQERANDAWRALGRELGFVWDTVQSISGKDQRFTSEEATPHGGEV